MKGLKIIIFLTLTTVLFMTGCMKNPEIQENQIKTIEDIKLETFNDQIGTKVGENFKVIKILGQLPGGETLKELSLSNAMIKATYGFSKDVISEEILLKYWFDENDTLEKNFLFNATLLTILVPNAKEYHLKVDKSSFSVSRDEMVSVLSEKLVDFPTEKEIWEKETVEKFLKKNKETIDKLVNSAEFRNQFFENFPIQQK